MNYNEAVKYINSLGKHRVVPGLVNIEEICKRLGNPQEQLKFVHIAGTNGKGSTLAYISTVLRTQGYRVGRYISPSIFDYRERIQVNGKPISKTCLTKIVKQLKGICSTMVENGFPLPTTFEVETALAFEYFLEQHCDIVVLETGMGGLLDATNIVQNTLVSVIATIGRDHMQVLGETLSEIATNKAGIIKPGCNVISFPQEEEAMRVIYQTVESKRCSLTIADSRNADHIIYGIDKQQFDYGRWKALEITLAGKFQIDNAILAIEALQALGERGFAVSERALRKGLLNTQWRGRFTILARKPLFIVDGAHNEEAAKKLSQSIELYCKNKRIIYIMGFLKDKEYEKIINLTCDYADYIIAITPSNNARALLAHELAKELLKVHQHVSAVQNINSAVEMSYTLAGKDDVIIAFGSLSFLGELIEIVEKKQNNVE